jgi:hypothetical protein
MLETTIENVGQYCLPQAQTGSVERKVKPPLRGTLSFIALTAAGLTGIIAGNSLSATYQPVISLEDGNNYVKSSFISSFLLLGYFFEECDILDVDKYLAEKPLATAFLCGLKPIIKKVYEGNAQLKISFPDDPDRGFPVPVVSILSGLPVGDDFIAKDELLYDEIQQAGLIDGLRYVILSQG